MTHPHQLSLRSRQCSTYTALRASARVPRMQATRMIVPKKTISPKWSSSVSVGLQFLLQQSSPTMVGIPTASMIPPNMIRFVMTDTAEYSPSESKMRYAAVFAESQQLFPVMAMTTTAMLLSVLRKYYIWLRMQLTKHWTQRAQALSDYLPLELMMICRRRMMVSSNAAKVKDPRWYRLTLPRAVQKQAPSRPQYQREHAVAMKKLRTQQRKMLMKMQTKMKQASIPFSRLVLYLDAMCTLARICTATTLTAQKTKNRHDRKKTQSPDKYTEGRSAMNLLAIYINLMPSSSSSLKQNRNTIKRNIITDIATIRPKLLLYIARTSIANSMQKTATIIVYITHLRQQRTSMRQRIEMMIDKTNIAAMSPGYLEKTTARTLLLDVSLGLLMARPRAEDWSAITKMPRTMKTMIMSTKKMQQQGSIMLRCSAGPSFMELTPSRNSTFSYSYVASMIIKIASNIMHHTITWASPALVVSLSFGKFQRSCARLICSGRGIFGWGS